MFMRENRSKNGAAQPEAVARQQSSGQKGAKKLSPNPPMTEQTADWRFTPDMSSPEAINRGHYEGGISGNGPYGKSYEESIPFVGSPADKGSHKLKG